MRQLFGALALSLIGAAPLAAAVERDEAKALDYLYCARVMGFNSTFAMQRGDATTANALRQMRTHFLLAATMKSDGEFIKREIPNVVQKFDGQHPDTAESLTLLKQETEQCSGVWYNDVRYLVGFEKKPPAAGSSQ